MKTLLLICVLVILASMATFRMRSVHAASNPAGAASPNAADSKNDTWLTDFSAAKQQAASEKKKLLVDFTGSDWCFYCQKLDAEVLATDTFKNFASDYILVRIDFPRTTELPAALKQQNDALAQQFHVDGFPTLVELDPSGQEITRQSGYEPGSGPQAYLAQFK
jgi:thioredoxin-related protein